MIAEGFYTVLSPTILDPFSSGPERSLLLTGSPVIWVGEWRNGTDYFGVGEGDPIVTVFWEMMEEEKEFCRAFYRGLAGSERVQVCFL